MYTKWKMLFVLVILRLTKSCNSEETEIDCANHCVAHLIHSIPVRTYLQLEVMSGRTTHKYTAWDTLNRISLELRATRNAVDVTKEKRRAQHLDDVRRLNIGAKTGVERSSKILKYSVRALDSTVATIHAIYAEELRAADLLRSLREIVGEVGAKVARPFETLSRDQLEAIDRDVGNFVANKGTRSLREITGTVEDEYRLSSIYVEKALSFQNNHTHVFSKIITEIKDIELKLEDMLVYTQEVQRTSSDATMKTMTFLKKLTPFQKVSKELHKNASDISVTLSEASHIYSDAAATLYDKTGAYYREIMHLYRKLKRHLRNILERNSIFKDEYLALRHKLRRARIHVDKLKESAQNMNALLRENSDVKTALEAVAIYGVIRDTILDARESAARAVSYALAALYKNKENIRTYVQSSERSVSQELAVDMSEANRTGEVIEYAEQKSREIRRMHEEAKHMTSDATDLVAQLLRTKRKKLKTKKIDRKTKKVNKKLNRIRKFDELVNKAVTLAPLNRSGTSNISDGFKITVDAHSSLKERTEQLVNLSDRLLLRQAKMRERSLKLNSDVELLKQNIETARALANRIKLSMSTDGTCMREYRVDATPRVSFSLRLLPMRPTNGTIFRLSEHDGILSNAFIVDVDEAKVRLSWGPKGSNPIRLMDTEPLRQAEWNQVKVDSTLDKIVLTVTSRGESRTISRVTDQSPSLKSKMTTVVIGGNGDISSVSPFTGCISDVVVSGKSLGLFNFIRSIGNCGGCQHGVDSSSVFVPLTTTRPTTTAEPTSCSTGLKYPREDRAVTFGDTHYSHSSVSTRKKGDLTKNFNITVEVRTFYPSGLITWLSNKDQTHFLSARLSGSIPVLVYDNRKGDIVTIKSDVDVTDGKWHSVVIRKLEKTISFYVDGYLVGNNRIARTLRVVLPMYVGGLPREHDLRKELGIQRFRGSMANFTLNDDVINLANSGQVQGITRCYSFVEKGMFLSRSSYIIYDWNFVVGSNRSFDFEIRTTKPNGLLVGISGRRGRPSLTVELVSGQVRLGVATKQGVVVSVTTNLTNSYFMCTNRWRHVRALIRNGRLSVTVGGKQWETVFVGNVGTKNAMVVGGFPPWQRSKGAAITWENFEGCFRNFRLDSRLVDWYSVSQVVDAHLSACPMT